MGGGASKEKNNKKGKRGVNEESLPPIRLIVSSRSSCYYIVQRYVNFINVLLICGGECVHI